MKIWVDDIRECSAEFDYLPGARRDRGFCIAHTSEVAIMLLQQFKDEGIECEAMSLDHDLGGDDTSRPIVLWMCENDYWPKQVVVHSANPVGREWLEGMIKRYKP